MIQHRKDNKNKFHCGLSHWSQVLNAQRNKLVMLNIKQICCKNYLLEKAQIDGKYCILIIIFLGLIILLDPSWKKVNMKCKVIFFFWKLYIILSPCKQSKREGSKFNWKKSTNLSMQWIFVCWKESGVLSWLIILDRKYKLTSLDYILD